MGSRASWDDEGKQGQRVGLIEVLLIKWKLGWRVIGPRSCGSGLGIGWLVFGVGLGLWFNSNTKGPFVCRNYTRTNFVISDF